MMRRRSPTYYDYLDALPDSSPEQLKVAYLRTVNRVHPDRASDEVDRIEREAMMRLVNEAWEVLRDPERRAAYDKTIGLQRGFRRFLLRVSFGVRRLTRPRFGARLSPLRQLNDHSRLSSVLFGIRTFVWTTRLGQWLLLLLIIGLLQIVDVSGLLIAVVATILALIMARDGDPTPLTDAEFVATAMIRRLYRKQRALLFFLRRSFLSLMERTTKTRHIG